MLLEKRETMTFGPGLGLETDMHIQLINIYWSLIYVRNYTSCQGHKDEQDRHSSCPQEA